jgi:hypothetical protein
MWAISFIADALRPFQVERGVPYRCFALRRFIPPRKRVGFRAKVSVKECHRLA